MEGVEERPSTSLSGHLLCAVPQLLDPNFHRSVVLMLEHSEQGSMGLVMNRAGDTTITEVADSLDLTWQGQPTATVRMGGPVEQIRGWILHDQDGWDSESEEICPGMQLTTSLEPVIDAGRIRFGGVGSNFLFLLGYAGWDAGQIESEIAAGSWVVVPLDVDNKNGHGVSPEFLLQSPPEDMWSAALHSIGVDPNWLVGLQSGGAMMH